MSDDQFTKLYKFMVEHFDDIDKKFENMATKDDIDRIMQVLDHHSAILDTHETERLALSAQVDRHEDRIQRVESALKVA